MEIISEIQFISRIFDYNTSKRWKYIAEKPCVIVFLKNSYSSNHILFDYLEQMEKEYCENISFYIVDVEQEAMLAANLGIRKIPTWLLLKAHKPARIIQGIPVMEELHQIIEKFLIDKN